MDPWYQCTTDPTCGTNGIASRKFVRSNGTSYAVLLEFDSDYLGFHLGSAQLYLQGVKRKASTVQNTSVGQMAGKSRANSSDTVAVTLVPNVTLSSTHPSNANHSPSSRPITQSGTDRPGSVPISIVSASAGSAAAFVVLLLIIMVFFMKKVKQQRKQIKITKEEIDEFLLGVPRHKANAAGMNAVFVLYLTTKSWKSQKLTLISISFTVTVFNAIQKRIIKPTKADILTLLGPTILGSGAFGQVVKGTYQGSQVAIKMLKNNASQNAHYLRSLLGELKVMSYLGNHPNLIRLIGAIAENIKGGEACLIFEYCSNENAHKFIRNHQDSFVDLRSGQAVSTLVFFQLTTSTERLDVSLTTKDLVRWAYEVASGMEYVCAKNVYRGDLAGRNILLTCDLTAKVGDFGLSKQLDMERYSVYVKQAQCPLPVKWMAIESLRTLTFSIQSDVWSFGVTLWEFFTLGATPYPGMDWNFDSWKLLCEGKRLDKPESASDSMYEIMMSCWDADPKARPSFVQLKDLLHKELQKFQIIVVTEEQIKGFKPSFANVHEAIFLPLLPIIYCN